MVSTAKCIYHLLLHNWTLLIFLMQYIYVADKLVPVTMACRVLRLGMEERPSDMDGSCEYTEYAVADSRQWVILQIGGWVRC
jgi:hypothetical protein